MQEIYAGLQFKPLRVCGLSPMISVKINLNILDYFGWVIRDMIAV